MPEYMDSYDEKALEIEQTFSYDGYQIVRREMFAHLREPAVTIRADKITFNTACIEGLEDAVYIHVMVSESEKRLVIKRCNENDLDSVRWCIAKPDKRRSRDIKGRFSQVVYKLMEWNKGCRYKILGHRITYKGETLYVFELENCEIFKERPKRTKAEREARANSMTPEELLEADRLERKASMTPFSPADVENTFGLPVEEHRTEIEIGSMNSYKGMADATATMDQHTAENIEVSETVSKAAITLADEVTANKTAEVSDTALQDRVFTGNLQSAGEDGKMQLQESVNAEDASSWSSVSYGRSL